MREKTHNKTMRFLLLSLIIICALCICTFLFLTTHMQQQSLETINRISTFYMSGMSDQIAMHFETTLKLQLSQVEALVKTIRPDEFDDLQTMYDTLTRYAKIRDFDYLALCNEDGSLTMIYGSQVASLNPQPFADSLNSGTEKISAGTDYLGNDIVLMGVPAEYPMGNGQNSVALVAALPADYIGDVLSLDQNDSMVYSFVIRQDGSFVIRSHDAYRNSYFDRVFALYDSVNGETPDQFIEQLQAAMAVETDYSAEFFLNGERRYLYCSSLPYTEWFLITFMSYGVLDDTISHFSNQWNLMALTSCAFILLLLLLLFAGYFRFTQKQVYELEEAKQSAESANKSKSEFLSNMSHDIRTPMNAIVGMTAIAIANIDDPNRVQNCLKKISLSSRHLLGLINDVLDMSKIESGKMTLNEDRISLREIIDGVVGIVQPQVKAKKQMFDVFIHDISTENVICDSVRLNQILLNLLSNAIKFTPEGGSVQISMYEEPSVKGDDFIRIHFLVKDSGIGMSEEFQQKIFDSFVREDNARVHKTEGSGLGMAITKYIVDAMEGTIDVQSRPGEGSEFHVTIDFQKAGSPEPNMCLPHWNMLVVDDNPQLCESAVESLKSIGVDAEWALDGESAVQMVNAHHLQHEDYQIILLDWKLPGMDGIESARVIRSQLGDHIPILLISAYDWSDIEAEARSAGINGFLSKPLFKSTLYYGLKPYTDAAVPLPPQENAVSRLNNRRILLAEDNELNWEVASELLTELGIQLEWAENGQICVDQFAQSPVGYYDAILMDIRMPAMTGYEATRVIRRMDREDANLPIIAMTADAFSENIQKCLECGMNAHVAKPIDIQEITRLLERFLS
ncbi:MAG: response regulator [Clostridia bacterium]|nr:response regulator [Clostridia bacterium]